MQQRMRPPLDHARCAGARAARDPVALAGKWVRRQADAPRSRAAVQPPPIDLEAAHPQLEQLGPLAALDPSIHGALQFPVAGEERQHRIAASHLPLAEALDARVAVEPAPQRLPQFVVRRGGAGQPVRHRRTPHLQRVRDRGERRPAKRFLFQRSDQPGDDRAELRRLARGEDDHRRLALGRDRRPIRAVLGHDQVRVRAARAERRDAGDARLRPFGERLLDHERRAVELEMRIQLGRMERGGELAMLDLQQDLGQSGDARGALAMADVRFYRADGTGPARAGECPGQCTELDWIAEGRACPVRLDVGDRGRVEARLAQRLADGRLLRLRVGHGEAVGASTVIDGASFDDPVDLIAVGDRAVEWLEQDRADSFARVLEDIAENGLPDPNECTPWEELRDRQYARLGIAGEHVA